MGQTGANMNRSAARPIRVLVVDDSAIVRRILSAAISRYPDLEVVGSASDPYIARDKILELRPDVITLDIEMPRMDGLTFLKKLMRYNPLPVIVISSLGQASAASALEAIALGAVEVFAKPNGSFSVGDLATILPDRIRAAAQSKRIAPPLSLAAPNRKRSTNAEVIAIGASTGGTEAIERILLQMPEDCPPILIAQHIPPVFSAAFANRLNRLAKISVIEARDGERVLPGQALIAPGNFHMLLRRSAEGLHVTVKDGPLVGYQRPSVDVLFKSIAETCKNMSVSALLTGMGCDGAQGLFKLRQAGARTIAQDEATSVVYGMPREAARLGAAEDILALDEIANALLTAHCGASRRAPILEIQSNG